jgi:hypothetical protein
MRDLCGTAAALPDLTIENGGLLTARPRDTLDFIENIAAHRVRRNRRVGEKLKLSAALPDLRWPAIAGR